MGIGPQDSICLTRQPSMSIDLIVTDKSHHRMTYWVIEPPDVQCSNLLATEQNIISLRIYVIISVKKCKENTKWEMHGKLIKVLIY